MILGVFAIACAAGIAFADDSSASVIDIVPEDEDFAKVGSQITYVMNYSVENTVSYTAKIVDSGGNSVGSVSSSSGSLSKSGSERDLTLTLPSSAGDYRLVVDFTEGDVKYQRVAYVKAVDPIVLSATVENEGDASRTFMVYFYIKDGDDWNRIEDSGKEITVSANGSEDVSYEYIIKDVKGLTFCLMAETGSLGEEIKGLGAGNAHTFYTSPNDYTLIEWICGIVLAILAIVAIWVYRKPVKNFGKPKGRR